MIYSFVYFICICRSDLCTIIYFSTQYPAFFVRLVHCCPFSETQGLLAGTMRYFRAKVYFKSWIESLGTYSFRTSSNKFQNWSNSVPLIGRKNLFCPEVKYLRSHNLLIYPKLKKILTDTEYNTETCTLSKVLMHALDVILEREAAEKR